MYHSQIKGQTSYAAGRAAEDIVEREYQSRGARIIQQRWRGQGGEIDLIVRQGETIVFIEVKKSRDFARAALRLGHRQAKRICSAASEFLGSEPAGQLTPVRFDLALVDSRGAVQVYENAFGEF